MDWEQENVEDRLSSLPDDVLIHILSFLPIKIYVKTCILGRRWRLLWSEVPNLDFDNDILHGDDDADARLTSIINRVMFLHQRRNINSFRFNWDNLIEYIDNEFEQWITKAVECNVKELDISLDFKINLPNCIFTSNTLVDLRISCCYMPIIGTVHLPALKKLHLDRLYYKNVDCFHHLISGCPVLNECFIANDTEMDPGRESNQISCCISSPTLNRLELQLVKYFEGEDFRVKLDTPALKYLKLDSETYEALSDYFTVPRFEFFASTETYHNITDLELVADWWFIPIFLAKANNLQVLTIYWPYYDDNPTYWMNPEQVPACLESHLETVRIRHFGKTEQEFDVVRYILRNARVLRRMEIYADVNCRMDDEAVKSISLFERGSDACQLAFH